MNGLSVFIFTQAIPDRSSERMFFGIVAESPLLEDCILECVLHEQAPWLKDVEVLQCSYGPNSGVAR